MTSEQFGQYMRDDIDKWSKLAKDRGIQIGE
jgi:tripartite-type tricarboxylate transporter receptor subunit TctC